MWGRSLCKTDVLVATWEVLCLYGVLACEHLWAVTPELCFREILRRLERKSRPLQEKHWPGRNFGVNGLLQLPNWLPLNPRLQTGLKVAGALCAYSAASCLRLERSPGHWGLNSSYHGRGSRAGRNGHWVVLSCSSLHSQTESEAERIRNHAVKTRSHELSGLQMFYLFIF